MNGQLADGQPTDAEATLRRALFHAAASVEPSAGGLDKIRAKIAARRSRPLRRLPADFQGARSGLAGPAGLAGWLARSAGAMLARAWDEMLDRFRPDPRYAGLLRWLRPVSAVATVAFVVAAASWVIATLPHTSRPVSGPNRPRQVISVNQSPASPISSPSNSATPGGNFPYGTGSPSPSPTCAQPGPHVVKPTPSQSPSVTPSPTPSPSPASASVPSSPSAASPVASMMSRLVGLPAVHAGLAKPSPTPSPRSSSTPAPRRTGPCLHP